MKQAFYNHMPYVDLSLFAMGVFAVMFFAIILRAWLRRPEDELAVSSLPLQEESSK